MTRDEFKDLVEVLKDFDFTFQGKTWFVKSEKNASGSDVIRFGEQYASSWEFESFGHLMAEAKLGNKYLKDALWDIER